VDLLQALLERSPSAPEYRRLLAQCFRAMAATPFAPRNHRDSSKHLQKATDILEELVEDFPEVADYRHDLIGTYAMSGPWWRRASDDEADAAKERLQLALKMSEELVAEHPNVPDYASSRILVLTKHAETIRRSGQRDVAEASFREALSLQSSLVEQFPEVARFKFFQTHLQRSLAEVLRAQKEFAEARSLLEHSVTILTGLVEHDTTAPFARMSMSGHYATLADVLGDMGEDELAAEARSQVVKFRPPRPFGPRAPQDSRPAAGPTRAKADDDNSDRPASGETTP
jgi:tetratricopeptide (TPR) repeat protein